jgi:hypothetical protein
MFNEVNMSLDLAIEYFQLACCNELSEVDAIRMEEILEIASNDESLNRSIVQIDALVFEDLCQEYPTFVETVLFEEDGHSGFNTSSDRESTPLTISSNATEFNSLTSNNTKSVTSLSRVRMITVYRQDRERMKQDFLLIKNQCWHYGEERVRV